MVYLFLFLLFLLQQQQQTLASLLQCKDYAAPLHLDFDDLQTPATVPSPYKGFVVKRQNTQTRNFGENDKIPVMNTSEKINLYRGSASSEPNVVFTSGENLMLRKEDSTLFGIRSFTITNIFLNQMLVNVDSFKKQSPRNHLTLDLKSGKRTLVNMDWNNIDMIIIGCRKHGRETCSHLTFDDFILCEHS